MAAALAAALLLTAALGGCGKGGTAQEPEPSLNTEPASQTETATPEPTSAETPESAGRADGERFEAVIVLEGMEETVQYEHIKNDALGFEMDYEYESFTRESGADRERFISVYDDPENPENYLDVTYSPEKPDAVASSVTEALSGEYEPYQETLELERAGSCLRIEASEVKGGGTMAEKLQTVYIIPAGEGSIVATVHCAIEAAEGFGHRFAYMLNTLEPIAAR